MRTQEQIGRDIIAATGFGSRGRSAKAGETTEVRVERTAAESALWFLIGAAAIIHQLQIP